MPHPHTRRKSHRFTILHRFIFWIQKDLCNSVKSVGLLFITSWRNYIFL